jgi:hypothetical protein
LLAIDQLPRPSLHLYQRKKKEIKAHPLDTIQQTARASVKKRQHNNRTIHMTHAQQHRQKSRNAIVIIIKMIKQKNGFFGEKEREMRACFALQSKVKRKSMVPCERVWGSYGVDVSSSIMNVCCLSSNPLTSVKVSSTRFVFLNTCVFTHCGAYANGRKVASVLKPRFATAAHENSGSPVIMCQ